MLIISEVKEQRSKLVDKMLCYIPKSDYSKCRTSGQSGNMKPGCYYGRYVEGVFSFPIHEQKLNSFLLIVKSGLFDMVVYLEGAKVVSVIL